MTPACNLSPCSHAISRRLSFRLAMFTMAVLTPVLAFTWLSVGMMLKERNALDLQNRCEVLGDVLALEARVGGEEAVLRRLHTDAPLRTSSRLEVWRTDGQMVYRSEGSSVSQSLHLRAHEFEVTAPELPGGRLMVRYTADFTRDVSVGRRWAWTLVAMILAAGALVSWATRWRVVRELQPLHELAAQTRAISPAALDQRLVLDDPAEELQPWLTQFNALMDRLQRAYQQLEAFNADVAHELRTPLATLIGQTELALSRERDADSLRDTLVSNLEEMQRLSALVNDMLFLSQADRGAEARRGAPVSLATLAAQVADFHEATLEDAGLRLQIDGDAELAVDEPLVKRALSNLLGNATRFAEPGSTLRVQLQRADNPDTSTPAEVQVVVENQGPPIDSAHLPRLFDRFFRADSARACPEAQHHGLGLAIVAAIARMHGGRTLADSAAGRTRVGFTLAAS